MAEKREFQRNVRWLLVQLPSGWRNRLLQGQFGEFAGLVVSEIGSHPGRARLRVPEAELAKVDAACILHRAHAVLACHRLAVVPVEEIGRESCRERVCQYV